MKQEIAYGDFEKVDIRVGRILSVEDFPKARKKAYKLLIDFGSEIGIKRSSAQIVDNYSKEDLVNKLILAVVNFPPKQIANFISEVLVIGVEDKNGYVSLLCVDREVELGKRVF
ncbi:Protein secretion chaperonin CsaA [Desulfurella amilsii]|uniref:Protein secretion chaperonin CsaA n=1 Tax=Desulfurella amilsii TaxID=1562698 RepID=A0A1X4XWS2_9BACT|nr:tRNA-binding protein [Desulfurella amilsii]OSS41990.1 Protein secretion chaperonin CsaA [Desulfurella amilsii]